MKQQSDEQARVKAERDSKNWLERSWDTVADFGGNIIGGVGKFVENVVDAVASPFASTEWIAKDHVGDSYGKWLTENTKGSYLNGSKTGEIIRNVASATGNMLPSIAITAITAGAGSASFMIGAGGAGVENSMQQMTAAQGGGALSAADRWKSIGYGAASGLAEGVIEKMSGGIGGVGKGALDGIIKKTTGKTIKNGFVKTVAKAGTKMAGEGLEEVASDLIDPILSGITYKGNVDYSGVNAKSIANTFAVGALTGGLMQGGAAVQRKASPTTDIKMRLGEINETEANLTKRFNKGKLTEAQYAQGLQDVAYFRDKLVNRISSKSEKKQDKIITSLGGANNGVNAIMQGISGKRVGLDKQGRQGVRYEQGLERLGNVGVQLSARDGGRNIGLKDSVSGANLAMSPSLAVSGQTLDYKPTSSPVTAEQAEVIKQHGKLTSGKTKIVFTDELGEVVGDDGAKMIQEGAYKDGVIYISTKADNAAKQVLQHEFTHSLEDTKEYEKFANEVMKGAGNSSAVADKFGSLGEVMGGVVRDYGAQESGDSVKEAKLYRSEYAARMSEKLFSDSKAIARLAKANSGLAARAMSYVTESIRNYNAKSKLTPQEREVKQFLHEIESNYKAAMRKAAPPTVSKLSGGDDEEIKYSVEKSYEEQVDEVLNNSLNNNTGVLVRKSTPKLLLDIGLQDLPMLATVKHIKNISTAENSKHSEYHGLSSEIIKDLPRLLESPVMVMDSLSRNGDSIVVITEAVDHKNRPVMVAIKINGKGKYNSVEIDSNFITSFYGKDNFAEFIKNNIDEDTFLFIDEQKSRNLSRELQVQFPQALNKYDYNIIIRKARQNVNDSQEDSKISTEKDKKKSSRNVRHQSDPASNRLDSTNSISKTDENVNDSQEDSKKNTKKSQLAQSNNSKKIQYSIKRDDKNRAYVKANRQVLQGDTPYMWGNQVEYFINEVIRKNKDMTITTIEGDDLTLTKNTAGKAKYWDASMPKDGYKTKLNVAIHIDEIAKVSKADRDNEGKIKIKSDINNKHEDRNFAKDGWSYRTAIFEDFDGQQYYINISIARDGNISAVYNESIEKKLSSPNRWVTESHVNLTSTNSISKTDENVNDSQEDSKKTNTKSEKVKFSLKRVADAPTTGNANEQLQAQALEGLKSINKILSEKIVINGKIPYDRMSNIEVGQMCSTLTQSELDALTHCDEAVIEKIADNMISHFRIEAKTTEQIKAIDEHFNKLTEDGKIKAIISKDVKTPLSRVIKGLKSLGVNIHGKSCTDKLNAILQAKDKCKAILSGELPIKAVTKLQIEAYKVKLKKLIIETLAEAEVIADASVRQYYEAVGVNKLNKKIKQYEKKIKALPSEEKILLKIEELKKIDPNKRLYKEGILAQAEMRDLLKAVIGLKNGGRLRGADKFVEALKRAQKYIEKYDVTLENNFHQGFTKDTIAMVDELVEKYDGKAVDKIEDKRDLDTMYKVICAIEYQYRNHNAIVIGGEVSSVENIAEDLMIDVVGAKSDSNAFIHKLNQFKGLAMDPRTNLAAAFGATSDNSAIMLLFKELARCEALAAFSSIELSAPIEEFIKKHKGYKKELFNKSIKIGEQNIEVGQAIQIIMQTTQDGVDKRLELRGVYGYDGKKRTEIKSITKQDLESIKEQLGKNSLNAEFAKVLEAGYLASNKMKIEYDEAVQGYSLISPDGKYVPLMVEKSVIATPINSASANTDDSYVIEYGINKHRVNNAHAQLRLVNAYDVFIQHADQLSKSRHMTLALRNIDLALNYNSNKGLNEQDLDLPPQSALEYAVKHSNADIKKYLVDLLQDIQGIGAKSSGAMAKMRNAWVKTVLGANIKTVINQLSGIGSNANYGYDSMIYGAKTKDLDNAIANGDEKLAKEVLRVRFMREFGGAALDNATIEALYVLYKDKESSGFKLPTKTPTDKFSYKDRDDKTVEYEVKKKDVAVFKQNYAEAAAAVNSLIASAKFKGMTAKKQASAINAVYDMYSDMAKAELVEGEDSSSFATKATTISKILSPADMGLLLGLISDIESDKFANGKTKPNSKKTRLIREINKFNLSYEDKQKVLLTLGYAPTNKSATKRAIQRKKFTKQEQRYLLDKISRK